jgi:hypothetical protein
MSDQDRKKKDGRRKDKKNKAMREAVKERDHDVQPVRPSTEQPNLAARE